MTNSTPDDKPTLIRLEVYFNNIRFVYSTSQKIEPKYWNKKNFRVKQVKGDRERNEKHKTINFILNDFENEITDNGEGILKENLTRIFSYGFSTKKDGKGFGLHTSALAMVELKGKLSIESDGEGKGVKFIVSLPIK